MNGTFLLENGSFGIMSFVKTSTLWRWRCRCGCRHRRRRWSVGCCSKSQQFSYQTKFAHIMSNCHTQCSTCVDCLWVIRNFYRLHRVCLFSSSLSPISSTMLISFHINDFCYFVSYWQYALNLEREKKTKRNKSKQQNKTQNSHFVFNWERHTDFEYTHRNAMQKCCREKVAELHLCYIRIYIFHEFVLEHALGNRINVYCSSQSCRHQTSKWRNCERKKKQTRIRYTTRHSTVQKKTGRKRETTELSTKPIMSIHKSWFQQDRNVIVCMFVYFLPFTFLVIRSFLLAQTNHVRPASERMSGRALVRAHTNVCS